MNMVASLKKYMQQLSGKKAPGPTTSFTIFHLFYTLELMAQSPMGRNRLAEKIHVGDGAVRTIISRLKEAELIEVSKEGCSLTEKGRAIWMQFEEIFPCRVELNRTDLYKAEFNQAFLVKNSGEKVTSGIDQRDAAIIAGARNALVIVFRQGHLQIQSVSENIETQYPHAARQIIDKLQPQENDVVIVAGAESALKAKRGAFAASWSLISVA
jgi:predicted transcriptional regulator